METIVQIQWFKFNTRPQIAELAGGQPSTEEDTDNKVDANEQSANISDFAQWVQQERFPLFVKVGTHFRNSRRTIVYFISEER